jgi:tetratricopeptide (TPR) repeat protein
MFVAAVAATLILVGCAAPPEAPAPAAPPTPAAAEARPQGPAVPEVPPAQAKPQAQKLAIEAVDQLQNGDEAGARATLDRALALDPSNELARKLLDQVKADAQKELGPVFFRYTVQRDDSLSKLAQQYLGDRFRFYILAKYNEMPNPSRLSAGQVIKIPGKAPATPPPTARPPTKPGEPAEATAKPEAEPVVRDDVAALLQKGSEQQKSGNLEAAYGSFREAAQREPGNKEAVRQRDAARVALLRQYDREATQAFQRQNLDLAITKWDRILELDPANQKAKLERERAIDLKKRMNERFGTK